MSHAPQNNFTSKIAGLRKKQPMNLNNIRSYLDKRYDKQALPAPAAFLTNTLQIIKLPRPNSGGYYLIPCPIHKGGAEKHESMAVHSVKGNFCCFACGARGSDVVALYMQVSGLTFKAAAKVLGAWKEGGMR